MAKNFDISLKNDSSSVEKGVCIKLKQDEYERARLCAAIKGTSLRTFVRECVLEQVSLFASGMSDEEILRWFRRIKD